MSNQTAAATPLQSPAPQRVLLVDNDSLALMMMRLLLESDGHLVTLAVGGQAGIDAFLTALPTPDAFQVVMTDLSMPHVDGRRVAAAVKAASPTTQVVLVSGTDQADLLEQTWPLQVDLMLQKPPRRADLRKALETLSANK
jgi:CheY-like chemotaxis protein